MAKLKKTLENLSNFLSQMILGLILFSLSFSGLGIALLLRHLRYNGTIIASFGVLTAGIAMFLSYLVFKGYIKTDEEIVTSEQIKKKK